jgi:hypothetical protein
VQHFWQVDLSCFDDFIVFGSADVTQQFAFRQGGYHGQSWKLLPGNR